MTMEKSLPPVQYLINEAGQRTGVVLNWESYQALQQASHAADPDLLIGLSQPELQALGAGMLAAPHQERLNILQEHQREGQLSADEARELDDLLERIDSMNTLKARARYTLQHLAAAV
jgi:hypothetical protein